ncbi:MAG: rhodanese-like domain-containing protein [Taibaiella sp.]|nr:rhodanese-like domain-containing protein [Taibaiella sp.]
MNNVATMLKAEGSTVVDVRTREEYAGGHVAGSINIPLNEVPDRVGELKKMGNLVLCCASGGRSGQATAYLSQYGINCVNGGSWINVNYLKNN